MLALKDAFWVDPVEPILETSLPLNERAPSVEGNKNMATPRIYKGSKLIWPDLRKKFARVPTSWRNTIITIYSWSFDLKGEERPCIRATVNLLNFLGKKGLRVSRNKPWFVEKRLGAGTLNQGKKTED